MMGRGLSAAEIDYLEDSIGRLSLKAIATKLGKNPKSLRMYMNNHGIPTGRQAADGISVTDFAEAVCRRTESVYDWIDKLGLPVKRYPIGMKSKEIFIDMTKFWKWAWENKNFLDFSNIEKGILGLEPEWVDDMRKMDTYDWGKKGWSKVWTPQEDIRLRNLLKLHRYTYRQLSCILQRSELAIQGHLYSIGEKLRPIPETPRKWSKEELEAIKKYVMEGYNAFQISYMLDRSEIQVKAKIQKIKKTLSKEE